MGKNRRRRIVKPIGVRSPFISTMMQVINQRRRHTPDYQLLKQAGEQKLFVYGTLMSGFYNNSKYLGGKSSKFLKDTRTKHPNFFMLDMGDFPGVTFSGVSKGFHVRGDLYSVSPDTIADIDTLEGNGQFYTRLKIPLEEDRWAWCYVLLDKEMYEEAHEKVEHSLRKRDEVSWVHHVYRETGTFHLP